MVIKKWIWGLAAISLMPILLVLKPEFGSKTIEESLVVTYLPAIEIEPKKKADASVIWLHGLGANGHDFEPIVPELNLPESAAIRFILPHAPSIPVTVNGGYVMPAWYDVLEMDIDRTIDEAQLLQSVAEVHKLIQREQERGIASERIIVVGFSQGGAVGYHAALTYPEKLGGLLGLSTYFATAQTIAPNPVNQNIPIKVYHGSLDPVVSESLGRKGYEDLLALGYQAEYETYPMEHQVCLEEIEDISAWLQQQLL
ncbi:alpha/beta hydrolase [Alkalimarinus sediminis]|uniref:alpha/beta hydrolase n=1 Tax=Alkalimarinus sediminis TaxID=1632866 RepID=UPI00255A7FD4|nr:carboxylesterase [Alkalimarinus sediminis]